MVQIATLRRRSSVGMAWLLVVSIGLLGALALGNTVLLLVAITAALLSGWLLLRVQASDLAPSLPLTADAAGPPRTQRGVWRADGMLRQAQVVPVAAVDGYQTVLTIDGYALVNAEGRIVYALNRALHAPTSAPVVVTIFDDEAAVFGAQVAAH